MKTENEIYEQLDLASESNNEGCKFRGMSYCEGVMAALEWILENTDVKPMDD